MGDSRGAVAVVLEQPFPLQARRREAGEGNFPHLSSSTPSRSSLTVRSTKLLLANADTFSTTSSTTPFFLQPLLGLPRPLLLLITLPPVLIILSFSHQRRPPERLSTSRFPLVRSLPPSPPQFQSSMTLSSGDAGGTTCNSFLKTQLILTPTFTLSYRERGSLTRKSSRR